jgi:hypothetical protein
MTAAERSVWNVAKRRERNCLHQKEVEDTRCSMTDLMRRISSNNACRTCNLQRLCLTTNRECLRLRALLVVRPYVHRAAAFITLPVSSLKPYFHTSSSGSSQRYLPSPWERVARHVNVVTARRSVGDMEGWAQLEFRALRNV